MAMNVKSAAVSREEAKGEKLGELIAAADIAHGSGHPARLTFGDCFSCALAKDTAEPLLFKGDDFIHTDVRPAAPAMEDDRGE